MMRFRRLVGRLAAPLALALGIVVVVVGLHHHGGVRSNESCAICTLSNTLATGICPVSDQMPALRCERLTAPAPDAPPVADAAAPSGRGPPLV
jgi:hypothetical protein